MACHSALSSKVLVPQGEYGLLGICVPGSRGRLGQQRDGFAVDHYFNPRTWQAIILSWISVAALDGVGARAEPLAGRIEMVRVEVVPTPTETIGAKRRAASSHRAA